MAPDGYLKVKIAEPNVWKYKHILVWEEAHGPISKGHKLIFLDRNRNNTALSNLAIVTDAEMLMLNRRGLITENADLTMTAIMVARVRCEAEKIKRVRKKAKGKQNIRTPRNKEFEGRQTPQLPSQK